MTEHNLELIRVTIRETLTALKREGLLKNVSDQAYKDAQDTLRIYYAEGQPDGQIRKILKRLQGDKYIKIIPLYFAYHYTIEEIAEALDVEISTVSRNKKRLCMKIYNLLDL